MKNNSIKFIIIVSIICIVFLLVFKLIINDEDIKPYVFDDFNVIEDDVNKGFTVSDKNNNEWVWIIVPKKIFTTAKNNKDYENIYNDIKKYTNDYQDDNYTDNNYLELKNKVLSSIYTYGGFYVSRYEIGTDEIRNRNVNLSSNIYSQKNKYVYNYVTLDAAIKLSENISNYDTNLLFGFQWDLICKFIETYGYYKDEKMTKDMILLNSYLWGNYYSSTFDIDRGKYSINYGNKYEDVLDIKKKEPYQNYLLTTGASENNKVLNIYDFAGDVSEWTLEVSKNNMFVIRDGSFSFNYGGNDPVAGRYELDKNSQSVNYGFRVSLIK